MLKSLCMIMLVIIHGDLDERIADLSTRIGLEPDNAALYVSRADLYFQHEDYQLSELDLKRAAVLDSDDPEIDFMMARAMHALCEQDSASFYLERYLQDPDHERQADAMYLRAEIFLSTGDNLHAAKSFENCIALSTAPTPDLFVKTADAYALCQPDLHYNAVRILLLGKSQLGALFVFDKALIQFFIDHKDYISAISILNERIDHLHKKAPLYLHRAEIHQLQGNIEGMLRDLDLASAEVDALPNYIRERPAMLELRSHIEKMKMQAR